MASMPTKEEPQIRMLDLEERIRGLEGEKRELEEQNALLRNQVESSPDGILVVNRDWTVRTCNRKYLEMWGMPRGGAAGSGDFTMASLLKKLKKPDEFLQHIRILHGHTDELACEELELKDGRVIERYWRCLLDPDGEHIGRICFFRDITRRKQSDLETRNTLRKSEELYRRLFVHHPLPLIIFDPATLEILKVNDAAVKHYGYEEAEFESLSIMDIRPPEDIGIMLKTVRSLHSIVENPGVFRHLKKDGTVILVDIRSHEIAYEERTARLVMCLDVTEQYRAREALEESEEKFRTAFMTSPDSININRLDDGLYLDINEGFEKITGYSREEVIGKTSLELSIWADPEDRSRLVKGLLRDGQVNNLEALFRMKDGTVRSGLMSAKVIVLGGTSYILSITRDISGIKMAQERIQASLREKEILLREIHHRVKNNLQVVSGLLSLQASFIGDPDVREKFRESENRVKAIAIMHEEIYQSRDLAGIDFAAHVRKLLETLARSYRENARDIKVDLDLDDVRLVLDTAIPCSLVITELVSNSLNHAFGNGREGVIGVRLHSTDSGEFFLQVSDNGVGFPENLDFRKTRSMGMQLVCLLVAQLGGTIRMKRDRGTTFEITFREYHEAGIQEY